jgi:hypothetical protein
MFSGLENLKTELISAVADTKLSKPRRELGLLLLDKISTSQLPGFEPSTKPTDGWLATDVISQQTQVDMWTFTQLQNRWHVPANIWDTKPTPTSPVPIVPKQNDTPDFEDEFED